MQTTSSPGRLALVLFTIATLTLGACSAAGSDDASTTSSVDQSSTTAVDETTTTDGDTTTTEAQDPSDGPTSDDLEAILPTAADIGSGWSVDPDDDGDSTQTDDQLDEQCPDVAALEDLSDEDLDVEQDFTNDDNQQVVVKLNPSARAVSDDELDEYVDAANACTGSIVDDEDGTTTKFAFDVSRTDEFGDQGIQIEGTITVSGGGLPKPVTITIYNLNYRIGSVSVEVSGQDGIDGATYASVPFDPDLLVTLGRDLESQVSELVGG
ncbi:hypothetical protein BH10ACT1_BH10ACT1_32570 [soil metagenome]